MQDLETPNLVDYVSPEEVRRRGEEVYETHVRPKLRPEDEGRYIALDVNSGDFEVCRGDHPAAQLLLARRPAARILLTRAGRLPGAKSPRLRVVGS